MKFTDTLTNYSGRLNLKIYKNGKLIDEDKGHNLIVTTGKEMLAGLLGGSKTGKYITSIGVGTSATDPNTADTSITNAYMVPVSSVEYTGTTVKFNFAIGNSDANGMAIREYGLFFSDGSIMSRRVRQSVIGKEADISITGYWEITF